ncbi:cofactor-independent phosphoglycerate mutase [Chloroflexota bacterium]
MKYFVLIMDGAAGWPLPSREGRTCLELARTPNLDALASEGACGTARTVPVGMEPSSACACMSLLGYDPRVYYRGRGSIEARSMEIPVGPGEVVFRCNLVSARDGKMDSYASGYIPNEESHQLVAALNEQLGNHEVTFYPGISYRHICKLAGHEETLEATCVPAHNIPGEPIAKNLPSGAGSDYLRDLMSRAAPILEAHPVNRQRVARGDVPANMIWLFWGSGQIPAMPAFAETYGLNAAITSGVDLLQGIGKMVKMQILDIPGVTGDICNDYGRQIRGALDGFETNDLVVAHVEAPDEAGHDGSIDDKIQAIERIDSEMLSLLRDMGPDNLRLFVAPDHPTPIETQTHVPDPVPFLMWGSGFSSNGAVRFTEQQAVRTGVSVDPGHDLMAKFVAQG